MEPGPCPHCGGPLEKGFVGLTSGIRWSSEEARAWRRLFPFGGGRYVVGNWGSTPWIRTREAHRCADCGTLSIPSDR